MKFFSITPLLLAFCVSNAAFAYDYLACKDGISRGGASVFSHEPPPSVYGKAPYVDSRGYFLIQPFNGSTWLNGSWSGNAFTMFYYFSSKDDAYAFCDAMRKECLSQFQFGKGFFTVLTSNDAESFLYVNYMKSGSAVNQNCNTLFLPVLRP